LTKLCEGGICFVEINKNDYNLASSILLNIVDEFHVTRGYLILFECDGNDKLLKYFNDLFNTSKLIINSVKPN